MKDYTITFEDREDFLYVFVQGERDSYEISKSFWTEIAEHAKNSPYKKIHVEEDIDETVALEEVFKLVEEFPELGITEYIVAFTDRKLDQKTINEFGQIVANNEGLNGKVFSDPKKAECWLKEQNESDGSAEHNAENTRFYK